MSGLSEKEIAKGLQGVRREPPAGLAETLQAQIPADIFPNESDESAGSEGRTWYREPWLQAAASIVFLAGAFLITRPLLQSSEDLDGRVQRRGQESGQQLEDELRLPVPRIIALDLVPGPSAGMVDCETTLVVWSGDVLGVGWLPPGLASRSQVIVTSAPLMVTTSRSGTPITRDSA